MWQAEEPLELLCLTTLIKEMEHTCLKVDNLESVLVLTCRSTSGVCKPVDSRGQVCFLGQSIQDPTEMIIRSLFNLMRLIRRTSDAATMPRYKRLEAFLNQVSR